MEQDKIVKRFFLPDEDYTAIIKNWDESIKSFPGIENIHFLKDEFIEKYGKICNLSDELIKDIIADKNLLVKKDEDVVKFLWNFYNFIYPKKSKSDFVFPKLDKVLPKCYANFFVLLVLSEVPMTIGLYKQKGLPEEVMLNTLKDVGLWVAQYKKDFGITGLSYRLFEWFQDHLNVRLFRIGRLHFQIKFIFDEKIFVYKNKVTEELQVLSGDNVRYNSSGLIDGVEDVWDKKGYWFSKYEETETEVTGNPISPTGFVQNKLIKLDLNVWTKILSKGDNVVNLHIPAGEPLSVDACKMSLKNAKYFLDDFFPDYKFDFFVCFSWLLDNQFENILKKESNILQFQHLGWLFPMEGKSEAIRRIFGPKAVDNGIDSVPHKSSMQRAAAEFIHNGSFFRNGGFFIPNK